MKHPDIVSAVIGGTFFAVPYLALAIPIAPSIAIGGAAFVAGELLLNDKVKETLKESNRPLYDTLQEARKTNKKIEDMIPLVEDEDLKKTLKSIVNTTAKIIKTIEKHPEKVKKVDRFFDYYLPVTMKLLQSYDEIENQELATEECEKFMSSTKSKIEDVDLAFKKLLSSLYQAEIVDSTAELKVFDSMLKADGYTGQIDVKKNKEEE